VGDLVLVGSCSGTFYALDRQTGQLRWSYDAKQDGGPVSFHGDALIAGSLLLIGADSAKHGGIYAFDLSSGKVRWKYSAQTTAGDSRGVTTDIVRDGNSIYATAQGDQLLCFDLATGTVRWKFPSKFDGTKFAWSNSPAAAGDIIYFGGQDGVLYALYADSGKVLWQTDLRAESQAASVAPGSQILWQQNLPVTVSTSPVLFGGDVYAATSAGYFYRVRASDGKPLASLNVHGSPWRYVALTPHHLVLMTNDLVSLGLDSLRVQWLNKPPTVGTKCQWTMARPYVWRDEVLAGDNGHLYAYRLTDGTLAWSHDFLGQTIRGIGVTEDTLYVGTLHGMVYAFVPPAK
jgi:outer membrane protein assembly factor BamB